MNRHRTHALGLALSSALLASCSNAPLYGLADPLKPPIDNRLAVSGSFCTEDPLAVEFPVKILFVVDVSQSMAETDPPDPARGNLTERTRAVNEVIDALAGHRGIQIGIISFQSSINDLT